MAAADQDASHLPKAARKSARFWTAPVLWRFDCAREMDEGRTLGLIGITIAPVP